MEMEQLGLLADVIDQRRGTIEQRWLKRVMADVEARDVSLTALRSAMPDYLVALVRALHAGSHVESSGAAVWAPLAREHAVTRVRLGFDIEQLVREFIALRQILFEVVAEAGLSQAWHTARLADLVESAVAVAVQTYIESRDFAARRLEAEHIGFITHELRNPLTTAELMASKLRPELPLSEGQQRAFDLLIRSQRRIRELIEAVLQVERFDADEVDVQPVNGRLSEFLAESIEGAEVAAAAKGIEFLVEPIPDILVRADPRLTNSVLGNLLDNAMKYTDGGLVKLAFDDIGDQIAVHVYDNCRGLSAEELRTIFEPFRRGGHSGKPGTGLGLAIARRAVEAQGGAIGAESATKGCHFWFTVPKVRH